MPQLDKLTYFTQIFWLLISFISFYFIILKNILPNILLNVKTRENITDDVLSSNAAASLEIEKTNKRFMKANYNVTENTKKVLSNINSEINTSQQNVNQVHRLMTNQKISSSLKDLGTTKGIIKKL